MYIYDTKIQWIVKWAIDLTAGFASEARVSKVEERGWRFGESKPDNSGRVQARFEGMWGPRMFSHHHCPVRLHPSASSSRS